MQSVAPQNRHLISLTKAFLNVHWDRKTSLWLAYSGGPDSKALLYALLECDVIPHLAHVDHGWRPESGAEAEALRQEAERLGCPFHMTRLELTGKGEDEARTARYAFFRSLSPSILLLAHQADDLAETVLKRIFEGTHLPLLGGMEPVSHQYGMEIWRPFLSVRRTALLQFLEERSLSPLIDPSNSDPAYLRARLRSDIFPFLQEQFGKEIIDNLSLLSERAAELRHYLDRRIAAARIDRGPEGALVHLEGLERIERRHLLQKVAREEGFTLSRKILETLLDWAERESKPKSLQIKAQKTAIVSPQKILFQPDRAQTETI